MSHRKIQDYSCTLEWPCQFAEVLQPDRELGAALRGGELVDLVDDDVFDVRDRPPELLAGEGRL